MLCVSSCMFLISPFNAIQPALSLHSLIYYFTINKNINNSSMFIFPFTFLCSQLFNQFYPFHYFLWPSLLSAQIIGLRTSATSPCIPSSINLELLFLLPLPFCVFPWLGIFRQSTRSSIQYSEFPLGLHSLAFHPLISQHGTDNLNLSVSLTSWLALWACCGLLTNVVAIEHKDTGVVVWCTNLPGSCSLMPPHISLYTMAPS